MGSTYGRTSVLHVPGQLFWCIGYKGLRAALFFVWGCLGYRRAYRRRSRLRFAFLIPLACWRCRLSHVPDRVPLAKAFQSLSFTYANLLSRLHADWADIRFPPVPLIQAVLYRANLCDRLPYCLLRERPMLPVSQVPDFGPVLKVSPEQPII